MTVDLRKFIGDDSAIRSGGFTGAVFLTYTLNLTFYEQMVAPVLDQAGCGNVLILADPDGYNGALEMGIKTISEAGRRYVCAPLPRIGQGIQHAKLLLMAGPGRGRMLIGSGNLTLHGYGRNLELFSCFECDPAHDPDEARYPFTQAWQFICHLANGQGLPLSAKNHIHALQVSASWLSAPLPAPADLRVWHNFDCSLWSQLAAWREERGLAHLPVGTLRVVSPYFDRDIAALRRLEEDLQPDQLLIHLDPALTNLDGVQARRDWGARKTKLRISGIESAEGTRALRHVHAKAIIGQERGGAWCMAGSANLSMPALYRGWQEGGNLELVTLRWSPDPQAFDHLFADPIVKVWNLNLADVAITESEPSEKSACQGESLLMSDLTACADNLEGRLSMPLEGQRESASLHFLRLNLNLPVDWQNGVSFRCKLPAPLQTADAARFAAGNQMTPYRWIDQLDVLKRHGSRAYQMRVKGKLETILGAEQLFQELMNFLWERIEPTGEGEDQDLYAVRRHPRNGHSIETPGATNGPLPPGPEGFVTEEVLVRAIQWSVEYHQPYDRSLVGLRDLLALVLLRLTTPTQVLPAIGEGETRDEETEQRRQAQQEAQQIMALERLRNFLLGYCRRYGRRLTAPAFMAGKASEVIFQNHVTLCQVLREFSSKAESVFSRDDLMQCFWWIWSPLTYPTIVGLDGPSALDSLGKSLTPKRIQQAWSECQMPALAVVMFSEVLGLPPYWKTGLWDMKRVGIFMAARELAARLERSLGIDTFGTQTEKILEVMELRPLKELTSAELARDPAQCKWILSTFAKILHYRPPMEEKYTALIQLARLQNAGQDASDEVQKLIEQVYQQGLTKEFAEYQRLPAPVLPVIEDDPYCPRCGARLTQIAEHALKRGELALCTSSRDAWIYVRPKIPEVIAPIG